ncbi:MAG: BadF/BadG/BcrA/BcrD ATPase family protein [Candidatus Baltobacteraceae bacterium]
MTDALAAGVDAGGTSTVAAVSRGGSFERLARGGPANATSRGPAAAAQTILETLRELIGAERPAALYVAAAGAGSAPTAAALEAALRAAFPGTRLAVEDDTRCALRAAIPSGPGAVLIAGTGSVAYAENGATRVRVGGAGHLLGDEGSAFAIGLAALKLLARVYDGRIEAEATTALAAQAFAAPDRPALLAALYRPPLDVARIASLAPGVVALADEGNRAAAKLVQGAARDLAELLEAAVRRAGLAQSSPALAFSGGLLRENSMLSFLLETRVQGEIPGASIVRLREEPVRAALRFAEALLS